MILVAKIQSYDIYVSRSHLYFPFDKSRTERNGKYLRGAGLFTYLLLTLYLCFINISYHQYWYIAICMIHTVYTIWNKAESNQLHKLNIYCCTVYTAGVFIVSSVQFNLIFAMLLALLCHGTESAIVKFLEMKMQRNTTPKFHHDCFWSIGIVVKTMSKHVLEASTSISQNSLDNPPFFSHKHFPTLSVFFLFPVSFSFSAKAMMRSFLFHSGSSLPLIFYVSGSV